MRRIMTADHPDSRVKPLILQIGYAAHALRVNTADLTHQDSLVQPSTGGNCLNWVVGHIVVSRNRILEILGREPVWNDERASRYARSTEPIVGDDDTVAPFDEILAAYEAAQQEIVDGLSEMSPEELSVLEPWFGEDAPKAVVLAGLVFHETYHVGQTGVLRRVAGRQGAIQ